MEHLNEFPGLEVIRFVARFLHPQPTWNPHLVRFSNRLHLNYPAFRKPSRYSTDLENSLKLPGLSSLLTLRQ